MSKKHGLIGAALAALVLTQLGMGQTSFTGVGVLPQDATSGAYAVSRDGAVVAAESLDGGGSPEAFVYVTGTGERIAIGTPAGWTTSTGRGIDRDLTGNLYVTGYGKNSSGNDQAYFYDASVDPATFTPIPFLTGGTVSYGRAIRWYNGEVFVVGRSSRTPGLKDHAFRWRKTSPGGSLDLGDTETDSGGDGNKGDAECIGIRPGGASVVRGSSETAYPTGGNNPTAFSWYSGDSFNYCLWWTMLGTSGQILRSHARGTSSDGRYIVGSSTFTGSPREWYRQAYLSDTEDSDLDKSCNPPGGHYHVLEYCVAEPLPGQGCNWGSRMLGYLAGHNASEAYSVSGDGAVVVGSSALIYDEIRTGGNMIADTQALGDDEQVTPVGTNTGSTTTVVVRPGPNGVIDSVKHVDDSLSYYWPTGGSLAFIWDSFNGIRNLKTVLEDNGLDLTGWVLTEARSVSADGTVICGLGLHNGQAEGWVATIGRPGPMGACCREDATCYESTLPECTGEYHEGATCAETACCHHPFADSDGDNDVDMDDFADFQRCLTVGVASPTIPLECQCWDQDSNGMIDETDFERGFTICGTGPSIAADPNCQ